VAGDDQVRAQIMRPRQMLELTRAECWQLLDYVIAIEPQMITGIRLAGCCR
jgi:hypothetical protein